MNTLVDKKFYIASLLKTTTTFTVAYLQDILEFDQPPEVLYTLIGELLDRGLLTFTEHSQFVFDDSSKLSPVKVKKYQLVEERRDEFEQYLSQLREQRLHPEQTGKPRGLCYRVLEDLIEGVIKNPEILEDAETREETNTQIEEYLAAAEAEEMSNPNYTSTQSEISEAYLRELYGRYLEEKKQWPDAIDQFVKASQLFATHNLLTQHKYLETHISDLVIVNYRTSLNEGLILEFKQKLDTIRTTIPPINTALQVVSFVVEHIYNDIEQKIKMLRGDRQVQLINNPAFPLGKVDSLGPLIPIQKTLQPRVPYNSLPDPTARIPSLNATVNLDIPFLLGNEKKRMPQFNIHQAVFIQH